jgi:hypothetical protein
MRVSVLQQIAALLWLIFSENTIAFSCPNVHACHHTIKSRNTPQLKSRSKTNLHLACDNDVLDSRRGFMKRVIVSATAVAVVHNCIPPADASEDILRVDDKLDAIEKLLEFSVDDLPREWDVDKELPNKLKKMEYPIDPRYFVAGGVCAAFSHGIATPFDVIKTKMQADPDTFNSGFKDALVSLVKSDGPGVLLTGLVPTLIGFGVEGAVKFGVYESLKPVVMSMLHADDKFIPYLAASVGAGAIASLMLVPMERTRIKMVTSGEKTGPVSLCNADFDLL